MISHSHLQKQTCQKYFSFSKCHPNTQFVDKEVFRLVSLHRVLLLALDPAKQWPKSDCLSVD